MTRTPLPREIWVLIGAAFIIAIGYGLISPVLPAYARSFDVGVTAASAVVSAFALFRLLFAPAGGALVSRLGERPVYVTGLLIVALSSGACAFAQSYPQLLLLRSVGGIGSTLFTVSAMALLVRTAPPTMRGRVSSLYGSSFLLGGMMGPVLGGALAEFGMRVPFLVYAVALTLAALAVALGLRQPAGQPRATAATQPPMRLAEALPDSAYRAALISSFASGWTNFGVRAAIVPLYAVSVHDAAWVAGVALAITSVGTALALQFAGRLADTIGRRPLILAGLVISGLGMAGLGFTHHLAAMLALCAFGGLGAGMLNPAQQATVADVVGNERGGGKVLAAFQMVTDTGAILGPILIGLVADRWGFGPAFWVTGAVSLLAVLPWLAARETLPAKERPVS